MARRSPLGGARPHQRVDLTTQDSSGRRPTRRHASTTRPGPRTLTVDVIAQQFAWRFEYSQPRGPRVMSTTLYLPQRRPVRFRVRSVDVIHSFFVPQFRAKIDAVPGITTELRVTPTRRGRYPAVCAELCGLGHALMRAPVVVVTPAGFRRWLATQTRGA